MAFESLTDKLQEAFKSLKSKGKISEDDVNRALRQVRTALLEADVNFKVAKDFIARIKEKALGEEVFGSLNPVQTVVKIVNDELTELLGGTQSRIMIASKPPTIIMLVGLQGAGKTTTAGKLAVYLRKQGKHPMLVAADVYRPAAIKQLQVVGAQIDVPVFAKEEAGANPVDIAKEAIEASTHMLKDVVIIDTAGRLAIDEELMNELVNIKGAVHPHEILLVVDSMIGQDAVTTAETFNEKLGLDGVILTKLDGDARGGAALSIKAVTGTPIKFTGTSEKMDGLEVFYPDRMASRILDLGDFKSLLESVQGAIDEEEAKEMAKKMAKNNFTLDDFLSQMQQVRKLGPLQNILGLLPGMGKIKDQLKDIDMDSKEIRRIEAIIKSMTKAERTNPNILNGSRRKRIAEGSGMRVQDVNRLLKQFEEARKMMKKMQSMRKGKRGMLPKLPFMG
ncbi:signal recognition particle protein [Veillonella magna]|uniref:Signal recognition particle protein n=1 Tax=Veillonella magna TaxID=464322 RepID=A0ABS2GHS9_9FIRM|nr:signal recognition particle protein [Veillonella magna]MBM6824574.1 signal recognition particle protein [Veillonella magna]MBM6912865.1 signal recognition particle protein [Veillonella magna]